nr:putative reverse transcriptase domain-containing protein [Tanacetum cinerariifolium]
MPEARQAQLSELAAQLSAFGFQVSPIAPSGPQAFYGAHPSNNNKSNNNNNRGNRSNSRDNNNNRGHGNGHQFDWAIHPEHGHSNTRANSHVTPDLAAMDTSKAYYDDEALFVGNEAYYGDDALHVDNAVGIVWRRLVSKGIGRGVAILHAVNRLVEDHGDDVGLSMLLVDVQNASNLVDRKVMLQEARMRCPAISRWVEFCYSSPAILYYKEHTIWSCQGVQQRDPLGPLLFYLVLHPLICNIIDSFSLSLQAWYLDDGTIIGDTLVVGKVLELIVEDGPRCGLHLNVDKTEIFWPKEDPRSRVVIVFPPNIS